MKILKTSFTIRVRCLHAHLLYEEFRKSAYKKLIMITWSSRNVKLILYFNKWGRQSNKEIKKQRKTKTCLRAKAHSLALSLLIGCEYRTNHQSILLSSSKSQWLGSHNFIVFVERRFYRPSYFKIDFPPRPVRTYYPWDREWSLVRGKSYLRILRKIAWSVKMPLHRPRIGAVGSWLSAPGSSHWKPLYPSIGQQFCLFDFKLQYLFAFCVVNFCPENLSGGPCISCDLPGFEVLFQQSISHTRAKLGPSRGSGLDGAPHQGACQKNTSWCRS